MFDFDTLAGFDWDEGNKQKKDIPYQSLMKMYLSEKVKEETSADVHSRSD